MTPISLQIVAVERRHKLQQTSLRIGIVFNVCSLAEHIRDRSREAYKYALSPGNLFHNTVICRASRAGLRFEAPDKSSLLPYWNAHCTEVYRYNVDRQAGKFL